MAANLAELLKGKRAEIVDGWFEVILATYPQETVSFFRNQKDPFQNPVGSTMRREIEAVFDQLLEGLDRAKVSPFVDRIVRIRAVQDYSASQAVGFVLGLKQVLRGKLKKALANPAEAAALAGQLMDFDAQVDQLTLIAFDIYMACREKIYEIKSQEVKSMYYNALRRMDVICPIPEQEEPDMPEGK